MTGRFVRLEPLAIEHGDQLWQIAQNGFSEIFRWYAHPITTKAEMRVWLEKALGECSSGASVAYATIATETNQIAGSTRFMNIDRDHRRVEIGNTWLAPQFQRTELNTEAKYLMMRHAFEVWNCVRVELKTDEYNERSRAAILRIGAREEGTLRAHMVCRDGRLRNSVYFSVLATEWPQVKRRLEEMLSVL